MYSKLFSLYFRFSNCICVIVYKSHYYHVHIVHMIVITSYVYTEYVCTDLSIIKCMFVRSTKMAGKHHGVPIQTNKKFRLVNRVWQILSRMVCALVVPVSGIKPFPPGTWRRNDVVLGR